ncbi:MAG TPA: tetratricopeptide repeat protein [Stellaceae bacterium]|nr:tetratricopeptide repeat protein [Stellaceae bacterium]
MATERLERRLAAILAADVAGYGRLIGADEEGTLARLKALRRELIDPTLAEHKGRIVKTTGDGLLVEFASVVDALRCAAEVQQAMQQRNAGISPTDRIEFRVGIHQGDIVVEDGDIFGDGVNIAARLETFAEPGGICVSARVQEDAAGRLDLAFEDLGEPELKNIARPVRVYRVGPPAAGRHAAGTAALQSSPPALTLPDKPSVAVLPFVNMSSDPEQEFFADGITDDIITALSRCPWLFVIARDSSFAFRGRAIDVKPIGRELGVRYALEGGVRRSGNRIRVTAQLVDTETGHHVWADRYDRDLADIFAVQDEITRAVSLAVAPAIADAELRRAIRKPTGHLDAWTAYQRGQWHLLRFGPEDNALAQRFFQQALEIDPTFVGGYKGLAWAQTQAANLFGIGNPLEAQSSAEALARQAIARDSGDGEAYATLGTALWSRGEYAGALAAAERALALSPNLAFAHATLGATMIFSGHSREGIAAIETSIRLDPQDPMLPSRFNFLALAHYLLGEYQAAADAAMQAIGLNPDYPVTYRWLAAALGQLGRTAEAKEALGKAIAIAPASFDMYVRNRVPWMRPEDHAHMLEGLRKAGWEG